MLPNHYNKNQGLWYCAQTTSLSDRYNDATVLWCAGSTLHLHDSYWLRICNGRERHGYGESSCMNHKFISLHDGCSGLQISWIKCGLTFLQGNSSKVEKCSGPLVEQCNILTAPFFYHTSITMTRLLCKYPSSSYSTQPCILPMLSLSSSVDGTFNNATNSTLNSLITHTWYKKNKAQSAMSVLSSCWEANQYRTVIE
jgi:hypothetical protein